MNEAINSPNLRDEIIHRVPRQRTVRDASPPTTAIIRRYIRMRMKMVLHRDAIVLERRRDEPNLEIAGVLGIKRCGTSGGIEGRRSDEC